MKQHYKLLITFAILLFSLSVYAKPNYSYSTNPTQSNYGTYVNEEIDVPVTQIGLPQQYTKPQIEEKGLEIIWNKWHAKVRNKFASDIFVSNMFDNYIIATMCTIDLNKKISDIIVVYIPENCINVISRTPNIKKDIPFYIYIHSQNKYYRAYIRTNESFSIGANNKSEQKELGHILAKAEYNELSFYKVPNFKFYELLAEKMERWQGQSVLQFPELTRRTSVTVTTAVTDLDTVATVRRYTADMFNDTERQ